MLPREEIKGLQNVVDEIIENKESEPFRQPVDYKTLNLIDYPIIIKHPMDLASVKKKLKAGKYKTVNDFLEDIQLIWDNCKLYNQEGSQIYKQAFKLEKVQKKLIKKYLPQYQKSQRPKPDFNNNNEEAKYPHEGGNDAANQIHRVLFNQKVKFSQKIKKLSQDQLVKVIQIIQDGCPLSLREVTKDKINIKVDDLNAETFAKINSYMEEIFSAEDSQS